MREVDHTVNTPTNANVLTMVDYVLSVKMTLVIIRSNDHGRKSWSTSGDHGLTMYDQMLTVEHSRNNHYQNTVI